MPSQPSTPCRLVGGPHDGDEGLVSHPLPEELWTVTCKNPNCTQGGVHWFFPDTEPPAEFERYKRDVEQNEVRLYVYADLGLDSEPSADARQELPAAAPIGWPPGVPLPGKNVPVPA